jgi:hypothetical protein
MSHNIYVGIKEIAMREKTISKSSMKAIYMRPGERRQLEALAASLNVSHSAAVRIAVAHYLKELQRHRGGSRMGLPKRAA